MLVLDQQPDFEVVAQAHDGAEAVERVMSEDIDLAILDVSMPRMTGLQAAREITHRKPDVRVLILSMHENEEYFFEALASRRVGLRAQDRRRPRPRRGVPRRDARRAVPVSGRGSGADSRAPRARAGGGTSHADPLTPREQEIVKLIAEAHTNEQIAELLFISKKTVERHRANILEKLGMRDRVELTRYAIRRGLVQP